MEFPSMPGKIWKAGAAGIMKIKELMQPVRLQVV
jgi:hypothetical protein